MWMRKDVTPIASSEPPVMPKQQVGTPAPSSPHLFARSAPAAHPGSAPQLDARMK